MSTLTKLPHARDHELVAEAQRELDSWRAKLLDIDNELTQLVTVPPETAEERRKARVEELRQGGEPGKRLEQQSRRRELLRQKRDCEQVVSELQREFSKAHSKASQEVCEQYRSRMVEAVQRQLDCLRELQAARDEVEQLYDELNQLGYAVGWLPDVRVGRINFAEKHNQSDFNLSCREMQDAYQVE